jgi:hypothetical protein
VKNPVTVFALFCEDIREESGGTFSLVGVLPDNVGFVDSATAGKAAVLPKLCAYIRINFDPNCNLPAPKFRLVLPDGQAVDCGTIEKKIIDEGALGAKKTDMPLTAVFARIVLAPLRLPPVSGVMRFEVDLGGDVYLAAALNITVPDSISTNGARQPS